MIERSIFEPGASAVHGRGGRGDDVNDRRLGSQQAWTIGWLPLWILRHQCIRITLLPQQDGDDACPHDDAAAANRNEHIRPSSARCGSALFHGRPGGILVHGSKDPGV